MTLVLNYTVAVLERVAVGAQDNEVFTSMMFPIKIAVMNAKNLWMLMVSAFFAFRHLAVPLHAPTNFGEHNRVLVGNLSHIGKALDAAIPSTFTCGSEFLSTRRANELERISGVRLVFTSSRAILSALARMRGVLKFTTTLGAYTFLVPVFLEFHGVVARAGERAKFLDPYFIGAHVKFFSAKLAWLHCTFFVDVLRTFAAGLVETVHAAIACACAARFEFSMTDFAEFGHGFIIPQSNDFLQAVA